MKIEVLENDHRLGWDGYGNLVKLVLKYKRRIFRVCDTLSIASPGFIYEAGYHPYYIVDHHGWRTSNHPKDIHPLDQKILDYAQAYLRLAPQPL